MTVNILKSLYYGEVTDCKLSSIYRELWLMSEGLILLYRRVLKVELSGFLILNHMRQLKRCGVHLKLEKLSC